MSDRAWLLPERAGPVVNIQPAGTGRSSWLGMVRDADSSR